MRDRIPAVRRAVREKEVSVLSGSNIVVLIYAHTADADALTRAWDTGKPKRFPF